MSILCKSRLVAVDGRRLDFEAEVYDSREIIGKAKHTRFIVDAEKFLNKTYAKVK